MYEAIGLFTEAMMGAGPGATPRQSLNNRRKPDEFNESERPHPQPDGKLEPMLPMASCACYEHDRPGLDHPFVIGKNLPV